MLYMDFMGPYNENHLEIGAENDQDRNDEDKDKYGHVVADDIHSLLVPRDTAADVAALQ